MPRFCRLVQSLSAISRVQRVKHYVTLEQHNVASVQCNHSSKQFSTLSGAEQKCDADDNGSDLTTKKEKLTRKTLSEMVQTNSSTHPNEIILLDQLEEENRKSVDNRDGYLKVPRALDVCNEDLSFLLPAREPPKTFAYIADRSRVVQELVKCGVKLYLIEDDAVLFSKVIALNYETSVKPLLDFLHSIGITGESIATVINKCPEILVTPLVDLEAKILYFTAYKFSPDMIQMMVEKSSSVLLHSIADIDERLSYLQVKYNLTGDEVRHVVSSRSRILETCLHKLETTQIVLKDKLEFSDYEIKKLLLEQPRLWTRDPTHLELSANYALTKMSLTHKDILNNIPILTCRVYRLQTRHEFLESLGKAQYNIKLPNYIWPASITVGNSKEFCANVAKVDYALFIKFLKTF